jgi:hypothetical protein
VLETVTTDPSCGSLHELQVAWRASGTRLTCRRWCLLPTAPLQAFQALQTRGYAAKELRFGDECRAGVLAGVEKLADAVQVTLGPKVRRQLVWGLEPLVLLQNCLYVVVVAGLSELDPM